ncbi:MAG TPA: efflux RND transporter periplasmic adaptor subunit [Burkholderiales bacterium]|nr:efflux RND transporter periplasmic adaptor subunit [Burkholderiales bacterium]
MNARELVQRAVRPRWHIGAVLALVAVAGYFGFLALAGPKVDAVRVMRRDIVQTVVASGRVAKPHRVDIGAQVIGTVTGVPVAEGQTVKTGETLIVLDSTEARALAKQAELAVAQGEARLRQLRELQLPVADQSLRQAEANLTNARVQYERNRKLFEAGYVGKAALDDAQRALDVAQTQVDAAHKQVETARPAGSDTALAVAALAQAHANLDAAKARLAYTTITAPLAGTLIARDVERGDVVQPGKALMVLSPSGATQLVLQIDERNLSRLRLGQHALASADAYPAQRFDAVVAYINPGVDAQRGTVEVKLDVREAPEYLRDDMTVSVDIETERHRDALVLPSSAVRDVAGPSPSVFVVRAGRAVRQAVKLGLRGEGAVEVLEGLREGDVVVAAPNASLKSGRPLRVALRG